MSATDHLNPRQFHGSTSVFQPGDVLTPEGARAHGHYERISRGFVHFSTDPGTAADYAEARAKDYGGSPHVYQVQSLGEHEHDPGSAWPTRRSTGPLRVVREMPEHEWDDYE